MTPPFDPSTGIPAELPGYLGKARDERRRRWDEAYGAGRWQLVHAYRGRLLSGDDALALYETAYTEHLRANPAVLDALVGQASEVYDTDPSNVASGFDWHRQEGDATHLQDIAVRRAVRTLGRRFEGQALLQIRDRDSAGYHLNPGLVPFHDPSAIVTPRHFHRDWIALDSVEDFWQSNKVLVVAPEVPAALAARLLTAVEAGRLKDARPRLARWLRVAWLGGLFEAGLPLRVLRALTPPRTGRREEDLVLDEHWSDWIWKSLQLLAVAAELRGDEAWVWRRAAALGPAADLAFEQLLFASWYHWRGPGIPLTLRAVAAALVFLRLPGPIGQDPDPFNMEGEDLCMKLAADVEVHEVLARFPARELIDARLRERPDQLEALAGWWRVLRHRHPAELVDRLAGIFSPITP